MIVDSLRDEVSGDYEVKKSEKGQPSVVQLDPSSVWKCKETIFSATFPPGEEPSPFIVDECRKHDPNFVVLWAWKVMETPAGTEEKLGHYVICRYVPSWMEKSPVRKEPVKLSIIPANFPFDPSRIFELESWTYKWPKGSYGAKLGIPDPPKPFDKRVVDYVEAQEWLHNNTRVQDAIDALKLWEENDLKELRKVVEEADYELKQDWKEMKKCVEEGRLLPPVFEPTPFVEVARPSEEN